MKVSSTLKEVNALEEDYKTKSREIFAQKYSYKGLTFGNTRPVFKIFYFGCKSFVVIWELMWHNKWENVKNKKNPD